MMQTRAFITCAVLAVISFLAACIGSSHDGFIGGWFILVSLVAGGGSFAAGILSASLWLDLKDD